MICCEECGRPYGCGLENKCKAYQKEEEEICDQCDQPMSEHDDGECPKKPMIVWLDEIEPVLRGEAEAQEKERSACERLIEGYKDLTFEQSAYIFDTMYEATKEN